MRVQAVLTMLVLTKLNGSFTILCETEAVSSAKVFHPIPGHRAGRCFTALMHINDRTELKNEMRQVQKRAYIWA